MTPSPNLIQSANSIVADCFSDLVNKGNVGSWIEPDTHTSDFDMFDGFKMRTRVENKIVYYNIYQTI